MLMTATTLWRWCQTIPTWWNSCKNIYPSERLIHNFAKYVVDPCVIWLLTMFLELFGWVQLHHLPGIKRYGKGGSFSSFNSPFAASVPLVNEKSPNVRTTNSICSWYDPGYTYTLILLLLLSWLAGDSVWKRNHPWTSLHKRSTVI